MICSNRVLTTACSSRRAVTRHSKTSWTSAVKRLSTWRPTPTKSWLAASREYLMKTNKRDWTPSFDSSAVFMAETLTWKHMSSTFPRDCWTRPCSPWRLKSWCFRSSKLSVVSIKSIKWRKCLKISNWAKICKMISERARVPRLEGLNSELKSWPTVTGQLSRGQPAPSLPRWRNASLTLSCSTRTSTRTEISPGCTTMGRLSSRPHLLLKSSNWSAMCSKRRSFASTTKPTWWLWRTSERGLI